MVSVFLWEQRTQLLFCPFCRDTYDGLLNGRHGTNRQRLFSLKPHGRFTGYVWAWERPIFDGYKRGPSPK